MDWPTTLSTVIGVIAGGLVNAYFSRQGSRELRREANKLKQLTTKLMLMMDDAGSIKVEWNEDGNPVPVVKVSGTLAMHAGMSDELQVGEDEDQQEPQPEDS